MQFLRLKCREILLQKVSRNFFYIPKSFLQFNSRKEFLVYSKKVSKQNITQNKINSCGKYAWGMKLKKATQQTKEEINLAK